MTNEEFLRSITLDGEIWKQVDWVHPTWYMVSNLGRIASLSRQIHKIRMGTPITLTKPHRIITPILRKDGYYHIKLSDGKKQHHVLLHRIIAKAFIPNPKNYPHIDHIDGNPANNDLTNLRWCTPKMNANNPVRYMRESLAFKGRFNTKSSKPIVQLLNGEYIKTYPSINEAGRNGFNTASVSRCCSGVSLQYKGYQWMFLSDYENLNTNNVKEL